jgi:hypothetical protein
MRTYLVYIAGPFRARSNYLVKLNVRRAEALALKVALAGARAGIRLMPVCPHTNTSEFYGHREDLLPDAFWLEGTKEMMRRCDAVILTKRWRKSEGACGEKEEAETRHIPVFEKMMDLVKYFKKREHREILNRINRQMRRR